MPKLILEYDLNDVDERKQSEYALKGLDALLAIYEIHNLLRRYRKYHEFKDDTTFEFFQKLSQEIYNLTEGLPEVD